MIEKKKCQKKPDVGTDTTAVAQRIEKQQRGKEQERTEQHDLLSDFTGLYGNVMTTKAALHLHGLLVFFFFPHEVSACASVQLQWV